MRSWSQPTESTYRLECSCEVKPLMDSGRPAPGSLVRETIPASGLPHMYTRYFPAETQRVATSNSGWCSFFWKG